jgi:NNP family nitrate/nitrite transporter-like MFS transporter
MIDTQSSNHKWWILVLVTATFFFMVGMARSAMPVLFPEISNELGLSILQMGTVWGAEPFAGVFVALLGGVLVDRFGIKLVMPLMCLAVGFFAALRGAAGGFTSLAAAMFAFGLFVSMLPAVGSKAIAIWFDRRRLGLANSISIMGVTAGLMAGSAVCATVLSPLLDGWRTVLLLIGAPAIPFAICWWFAGRASNRITSGTRAATTHHVPFREALGHVLKNKQLWLASLFMVGAQGAYTSFTGYLPTYFIEMGWETVPADTALTVFLGSVALFSPVMAIISDRLGTRKRVIIPALIAASVAMGLVPLADGAGIWVLVIIQGIMRSGIIALFISMIMEFREVGLTYAGTAIGVVNTVMSLGGALLPIMGNALADIHLGLPIVFWAVVSLLLIVPMLFVRETRRL